MGQVVLNFFWGPNEISEFQINFQVYKYELIIFCFSQLNDG